MSYRSFFVRSSAALLLAACCVSARAASLTNLEWQPEEDGKSEALVMRFSAGVPALDVDTQPWGLSVRLPGIKLEGVSAEGLRIAAEGDGSRLSVERPGIELRSVRLEGDSLRLVVTRKTAEKASSSAYRIGIGDLVAVSVYKNADLSGEFTIAPDGTLNLPLVGPILAKGLTDVELTAKLRDALERDFLVDPQVSASVKTYQSQWVYIAGSVAKAERVAVSPGMTIKDILSQAGIALGPSQQIVLSRAGGGGESITIDVDTLDSGSLPLPRDGDVLSIQEPSYVFVQGEVRRPGRFPMSPSMTMLQAITLAEGLTEWASRKDIRIRRTQGGETVEQVVSLKKIDEQKAQDPELKPGDFILVKRKVL